MTPVSPRIVALTPTVPIGECPTGTWSLGIIGDPVEHSISPALQGAGLSGLGISATYERWHTTTAELPERIVGLRRPDVLGANVTVPHKQAVIPLLDAITPLAAQAGAVNTIIHRDGVLHGDNTDIYGFRALVLSAVPVSDDQRALILGAGGASRSVILALAGLGPYSIAITNRSPGRADALAREFSDIAIDVVMPDSPDVKRTLAGVTLVVNATTAGWNANEYPIDPDLLQDLPASAVVLDLTYRDTPFLQAARALGLTTVDGLGMLIHQGVRALELWTGMPAPLAAMEAAAVAARE